MSKKRHNGEGSIRQRPDGLWEARLTLPDGRRKSFYDPSRQVVARRLSEALRDRDRGLPVIGDERQTVEKYLTLWLEQKRSHVRYGTWRRYEQLARRMTPAIGDLRLTKLSAQHVAQMYARLLAPIADGGAGLGSTTVHHAHVVLRMALDEAVKQGILARNVTDLVTAPQQRRPVIQPYSEDEAQRLLAAADGDRLQALYTLALSSGLRIGELLALTWRQVDLQAGALRVIATLSRGPEGWTLGEPKTQHSRRSVMLTPLAIEALRAHRARQVAERLAVADVWADRDLVFCDTLGGFLSPEYISRHAFPRLIARAGVPRRRFHDLRHSCATLLLKAGVPLKVVSEMLGHTTIAITADVYGHVTAEMQRDAARAMEAILTTRARQA
ncbi:MAG TPA: site-specific integrase [Ktedonobacterales bacterium]|nr:site-specific integrase [Ktedonobacterales bacterium]